MENEPFDSSIFGTSRSFKEQLNDPKNPNIYCLLSMDGKEFLLKNSYSTQLHQKTADHDTFSITVPSDAIDSFKGYVMENSKNLLDNYLTINFWQYGKIQQVFNGIIKGIDIAKVDGGGYGDLIITGSSPSSLLESGKDCQSFEDKTLEEIIKEVCQIYPTEAQINVDLPNVKHTLPYTVQYKESDYQFIQRLAKRHGEFFYYNGEQTIFGTGVQPIIKLREGNELADVRFSLKTGAQDFSFIGYDVQSGMKIEKDGTTRQSEFKENLFQSVATNRSKNIFKKKPKMHFNHTGIHRQSERELEEAVRLEKEKRENLMLVIGKSYNPAVRIGGRVELSDINGKAMETYRIIEIKHIHDPGDYYNEFTAIPDLFNAAHYIDTDAVPKGEAQPARVVDNNDPMGMGRVRVQFPWQEEKNQMTPWIRTTTGYAGANRGDYKIPEIGDEILVGFESGNAEKPFMLGALYNGAETSGYHTAGNDLKVIKTRSGIEQIYNDAEGSWKQSTPDGNFIYQDGQGNININATKNLNINVGENFNINVGQNISFLVGLRAIYNIGMQMMMNTPILRYFITDNYHLQSPKTLINGEGEIKIEAKETQVAGYEKLFVHSDKSTIVNSKGLVEVKGEEGTSNTNVADVIEKVLPLVDTKCIVHFRPQAVWKGEFGFCYYREKNNEVSDSEEFEKLLGKYYQFTERELTTRTNDTKFTELLDKYYISTSRERLNFPPDRATANTFIRFYISDPNKWFKPRQKVKRTVTNGNTTEKFEATIDQTIENFKNDSQYKESNNTLQILKDEYSNFTYNKKKKKGKNEIVESFVYYGSFIALFPKTANYGKSEASIDLKISFLNDEKPDYLIFKVDEQELKADNAFIGVDRLKIENPKEKETIIITCKTAENFTTNKNIEIFAVKKQGENIIETKAGCITMIAPKVRTLNVVTVGVKTLTGNNPFGSIASGWLDFYKKSLGQALIKVNIIDKQGGNPIQIDISGTTNLTTTLGITNNAIASYDGLDAILNNKFETDYPNLVDGHFKLYFMDLPCVTTEDGGVAGYSNHGWNYGVMFSTHSIMTIAHESLHAMYLPHSFYHYNSSYVFKAMNTNNIMDYSHLTVNPANGQTRTAKDRYLTWYWQWRRVWTHSLFSNQ